MPGAIERLFITFVLGQLVDLGNPTIVESQQERQIAVERLHVAFKLALQCGRLISRNPHCVFKRLGSDDERKLGGAAASLGDLDECKLLDRILRGNITVSVRRPYKI